MSWLLNDEFSLIVVVQNRWSGKGVDEVGKDSQTDRILVRVDPMYFRPAEVE